MTVLQHVGAPAASNYAVAMGAAEESKGCWSYSGDDRRGAVVGVRSGDDTERRRAVGAEHQPTCRHQCLRGACGYSISDYGSHQLAVRMVADRNPPVLQDVGADERPYGIDRVRGRWWASWGREKIVTPATKTAVLWSPSRTGMVLLQDVGGYGDSEAFAIDERRAGYRNFHHRQLRRRRSAMVRTREWRRPCRPRKC